MFKSMKKQTESVEPVAEEISEEQLSQVTGGAGASGLFGILSGVTGLTGQQLNAVSVSPLQIQVGGITISTPEITPTSLLP